MVEVADGPQAGASAISTDSGIFEISGTSTGSVMLRTSKDGSSTATQNASWRPAGGGRLVTVTLESLGPSLGVEPGNYSISVTANRATSRDGAARAAASQTPS